MAPQTSQDIVHEALFTFNEDQLKDLIRVAQRRSKAVMKESRSSSREQKRTKRFWDRSLSLDWTDAGLPKVQFPKGRCDSDHNQQLDVFDLLKGSARPAMTKEDAWVFEMLGGCCTPSKREDLDWDILNLLSPSCDESDDQWIDPSSPKYVEWDIFQLLNPRTRVDSWMEEDDFIVDWSDERLPEILRGVPPHRRPGHAGRVRTGKHHRPVEPRRRVNSKSEVSDVVIPVSRCAGRVSSRKTAGGCGFPAHRAPLVMRPVRIQQPCGGGR